MKINVHDITKLSSKEQKDKLLQVESELKLAKEEFQDAEAQLKQAMKSPNIDPYVLKSFIDYRNEKKLNIDDLLYNKQLLEQIINGGKVLGQVNQNLNPRDKISGSLHAGAGVVNLRNTQTAYSNKLPTFKEIVKAKQNNQTLKKIK